MEAVEKGVSGQARPEPGWASRLKQSTLEGAVPAREPRPEEKTGPGWVSRLKAKILKNIVPAREPKPEEKGPGWVSSKKGQTGPAA